MTRKFTLAIILMLCLSLISACNASNQIPSDATLPATVETDSSKGNEIPSNNGADIQTVYTKNEKETAVHQIKTKLQNIEHLDINKELVEIFYNYQIESGPYQSYELRLFPDFDSSKKPDWDELTLFVFMMSDQVERDSEGIYTLTKKAFEETVKKFFAKDFSYIHRSSRYLKLSRDTYTPTGWDVNGSVFYRLHELKKNEKDTFTAIFNGFSFWEHDSFNEPYDRVSENMKAMMDYVGEGREEIKWFDLILEIFKDSYYLEILKKAEQLEITFKLSPEQRYAFKYLESKRTNVD